MNQSMQSKSWQMNCSASSSRQPVTLLCDERNLSKLSFVYANLHIVGCSEHNFWIHFMYEQNKLAPPPGVASYCLSVRLSFSLRGISLVPPDNMPGPNTAGHLSTVHILLETISPKVQCMNNKFTVILLIFNIIISMTICQTYKSRLLLHCFLHQTDIG